MFAKNDLSLLSEHKDFIENTYNSTSNNRYYRADILCSKIITKISRCDHVANKAERSRYDVLDINVNSMIDEFADDAISSDVPLGFQ